MGLCFPRLRSPVRVSWATYPRNFLASYLVSMVSRVLWSPEGLVEVRVSWPGHPRYQKKKLFMEETRTNVQIQPIPLKGLKEEMTPIATSYTQTKIEIDQHLQEKRMSIQELVGRRIGCLTWYQSLVW